MVSIPPRRLPQLDSRPRALLRHEMQRPRCETLRAHLRRTQHARLRRAIQHDRPRTGDCIDGTNPHTAFQRGGRGHSDGAVKAREELRAVDEIESVLADVGIVLCEAEGVSIRLVDSRWILRSDWISGC